MARTPGPYSTRDPTAVREGRRKRAALVFAAYMYLLDLWRLGYYRD